MRVAVGGGLRRRNAVGRVPGPGQRPPAVLLRRGAAMVSTADAGVPGARGVQSLHLFDGQPHRRRRLQRDLPNGLLQAASRAGAVAHHGLWALASPPQPSGVVKDARLADITVHFQRAPFPDGKVQLPGRAVPVERRGFGEGSGAVPRQGVGSGACRVAQGRCPQALPIGGLVGQAAGSQGHGGLPREAQRAVPLDGELRSVAAELLVVLDDVSVRGGDAAGVVDVVVLDLGLRGRQWGTGDRLRGMWDVRLVIDEVRVLPFDDVRFGVAFRLLPDSHVIAIGRDVVRVIKRHVLTAFLLLLLLRFLLLFWPLRLLPPALVAEDEAEHQQCQHRGTAAHDGRHGPERQGQLGGVRGREAHVATVDACPTLMARSTQHSQAGHHGLTRPSRVRLRAAAGEAWGMGGRLAAAPVVAGTGGAGPWGHTLVGEPAVDAHQLTPAGIAGAHVGAAAANLYRGVCFGERGQAVLAREGKALPAILDVGNAAVEA